MKPITLQEKLIYRTIKKAAIIWLLLLRLDPEPVNESKAAEILQIDRETARTYLKTLNELEICTRLGRYQGYILTDTGRQLALPAELTSLLSKAENPPSVINTNKEESFKESKQLILISEDENPALEGGKSALENKETISFETSKVGKELLRLKINQNWRTQKLIGKITLSDISTMINKMQSSQHSLNDTGYMIRILEGMAEVNDRAGGTETNRKYEEWEI